MTLSKDDLKRKQKNRNELITTGKTDLSTVSKNFGLMDLSNTLNSVAKTGSKKEILEQAREVIIEINGTKLHLIFIIDESASCQGTELDTKTGFSDLIKHQSSQIYSTYVSTILFADSSNVLYKEINSKKVPSLEYIANGASTSLYDALCNNLSYFKNKPGYSYDYTIVVIMTDGLDNSSISSLRDAQNMIQECLKLGWEFLFLGTKINSKDIASSLGIDPSHAEDYNTANGGIIKNFEAILQAIKSKLLTGKISKDWSDSIRKNNSALGIDTPKRYLLGGK